MKKTLLTLIGAGALTVATVASAAPATAQQSGLYMTGLAGYGAIHYKKDASESSFDHSGFMWAAQLGYRITRNLAVEGGYMQLPTVKAVSVPLQVGEDQVQDTAHLYTSVVDVMVKGIYPINAQSDVFASAGVGRTSQSVKSSLNGSNTSVESGFNEHKIVPIFAVGGDYNLNEHFAVTAEAISTLKSGDVKSSLGALAGITYKF